MVVGVVLSQSEELSSFMILVSICIGLKSGLDSSFFGGGSDKSVAVVVLVVAVTCTWGPCIVCGLFLFL